MVMLLIIGSVVFSILIFVSKKNIRKAFLAAITAEAVAWPVGLLLVSFGKIEYPIRLFPKAIESSFLHGYILNPSIYAIYYIHYPKQAKLIWRWVYTLLITAIPVSIEIMANKYTNLVHYKAWSGFYSWMLLIIFYFITRKYLDWFLENAPKQGVPRNEV
jgi:hypothetical protein